MPCELSVALVLKRKCVSVSLYSYHCWAAGMVRRGLIICAMKIRKCLEFGGFAFKTKTRKSQYKTY